MKQQEVNDLIRDSVRDAINKARRADDARMVYSTLAKCSLAFRDRCRAKFPSLSAEKENILDGSFVEDFLRHANRPDRDLWNHLCHFGRMGFIWEYESTLRYKRDEPMQVAQSIAGDLYLLLLEHLGNHDDAARVFADDKELSELPQGDWAGMNRRLLEWIEAGLALGPFQMNHHYPHTSDANKVKALISTAIVASRIEMSKGAPKPKTHRALFERIATATGEEFPEMHPAELAARRAEIDSTDPIAQLWLIRLWPFFTRNEWSTVEVRDAWLMKFLPEKAGEFRSKNDGRRAPDTKYFLQQIRRLGLRTRVRGGRKSGARRQPPGFDFLTLFDFKNHLPGMNPLLYRIAGA